MKIIIKVKNKKIKVNKIYQGNCLDILKIFPNNSINCCITSPPYWRLRDYGTAKWKGGNEKCDHKETRSFINPKNMLGPNHHLPETNAANIMVQKQYRSICKKCGAKRIDSQLGLEKTFQKYINKLCNIFDKVKRVLKNDGTCWVVIGDTYGGANSRASNNEKTGYENKREGIFFRGKPKCLCMIPFQFAIEMVNRGWILRNTIIWQKPNCMPSSVNDRFTVDFEYVFLFVKNKKYYFKQQFEKSIMKKPQKRIRPNGLTVNCGALGYSSSCGSNAIKRNKRTVWTITTKPFRKAHFATYPENLIMPMIKAGCPKNGIILDPFIGSGTTGVAALKLNRKYVGIELNLKYINIANKRITKTLLEIY